jgi:hypothetical protein
MQMLAQLLKAIKNHVTGQTLQKHKAHKKKSNLHKTVSKPLHYIAQFNKDYSASQVISELLLQTE